MKKTIGRVLAALALAGLASCQSPVSTWAPGPESALSRAVLNTSLKQEAEAYSAMLGVQLEASSEGGQNVGWIDAGDWMVYPLTVNTAGTYTVSYRVASPNSGTSLTSDLNAGATVLGSVAIPNTGGWQTWTTVTQTVQLPAGTYNFGINGGTGGYNLNWIQFDAAASGTKVEAESYSVAQGVIKETTTDAGGGQNVGAIDAGDWMVYPVTIPTTGSYTFQYRVSSIYAGKSLSTDLNAGSVQLGSVAIPNTGNWQTWTTVSQTVNLNAGTYNFGINGGTGGFNLNWFTFTFNGGGGSGLIPLAAGKQMTFQFQNNTGGRYSDSQIWVLMIARDSSHQFAWLDKYGNLNRAVSGQNASSYAIKLSDFAGFQFPTYLESGRLYVSLGAPLDIPVNTAGDGSVGIAFPNIENPSDANINTYFEWVEFAVLNNEIWCNTTQVDQFGFPLVMELFTGSANSYQSFGRVGITESRAAIYSAWNATVPNEFKALATTYRILAPIHGNFRPGQANGTYFDPYINSVWAQYTTSDLVITVPQGTFTGRVQGDGRLRFTRPGDAAAYYVSKPTSEAVWGGLGALATGNTIELVLQAQICAAFHRHVMQNASAFNTPSQYYLTGPADYFSKFWHDHSINRMAYGFCYDDVNDQSSTLHSANPRGIVLSIGF